MADFYAEKVRLPSHDYNHENRLQSLLRDDSCSLFTDLSLWGGLLLYIQYTVLTFHWQICYTFKFPVAPYILNQKQLLCLQHLWYQMQKFIIELWKRIISFVTLTKDCMWAINVFCILSFCSWWHVVIYSVPPNSSKWWIDVGFFGRPTAQPSSLTTLLLSLIYD